MNLHKLLTGAIVGVAGALVTDLDAFIKAPSNTFDWKLAAARYIKGAIVGVLSAAGLQGVGV